MKPAYLLKTVAKAGGVSKDFTHAHTLAHTYTHLVANAQMLFDGPCVASTNTSSSLATSCQSSNDPHCPCPHVHLEIDMQLN